MPNFDIKTILQRYRAGELDEDATVNHLRDTMFEDMGFAKIDHHRQIRQGFPEVVYAEGKTPAQVAAIMRSLCDKSSGNIMATRADVTKYKAVQDVVPEAKYDEMSRIIYVQRHDISPDEGRYILVLTAGTSDMPVAEEAKLTAQLWGNVVHTCYDCGVAGIHRLFAHIDEIRGANVIIVIAGMEGALASVVGGLTDRPVIAVPTSVGYGASFGGLSALLSMLNSCSSGVSVVNIDNGFGAGVLAGKINRVR